MPVFNNILAGASGQSTTGYDIDQSLRFKDGSSGGKLTFTPASAASSDKKYTYSFWFKGKSDMAGINDNKDFDFLTAVNTDWDSCSLGRLNGKLAWFLQGGTGGYIVTTQEFRDPASWYHCVLRYDSTDATAGDRMRMFVNGEEVTAFDTDTNPALNYSILNLNQSGVLQEINRSQDGSYPASCYMAEVHMIDGTALGPASFGQTDAATNQWKPIEYTGSYGTNGFYQKYGTPHGITAFTSTGADTWTCPTGVTSVNVLTVAGGGGGSGSPEGGTLGGGAGGAGGLVYVADYTVVPGVVYDLTVGAGGGGGTNANGTVGTDSVFNVNAEGSGSTLTAKGGGYGARHTGEGGTTGGAGGSGGGAGHYSATGGAANQGSQSGDSGTYGFGYAGGDSGGRYASNKGGGGGGGAGAVGQSVAGGVTAGGVGKDYSSVFGTEYGESGWFAGGGGGGTFDYGGAGGNGGGGDGKTSTTNGDAGLANTGGGGGGTPYGSGGAGGSGVILISIDAGFGADSSGNGNNFTPTNLVATDQMIDTPTNNYCTLNPLNVGGGSLSEGNLEWDISSSTGLLCMSSVGFDVASTTNKYYWEVLFNSGSCTIGIAPLELRGSDTGRAGSYSYYSETGTKYLGASGSAYGASFTSGDIIGISVGDGTIEFFKNNVSQGDAWTGLTGTFVPFISEVTCNITANFGQDSSFAGNKTAQGNGGTGEDFYYTPPTGFVALNTDNLSAPAIALPTDHFETVLFTGTGATRTVATSFQSDFAWFKQRDAATGHLLYNTITGGTNSLVSNTTAAEAQHGDAVLTFNSADIQIAGTDTGGLNGDTNSMVLWNWKAGGAASTIAAGSIDGTNPTIASSVSANPTAGFSIVSYTGNATAGATVGHGLSSAPDMIILKDRDAINSWRVYSSEIPNTQHLILNDTNALVTGTHWNNTTATSSVFSLGSNDAVNGARGFIAYCFHSIEGYSKVGSYEGNGNADGSFIYLGFKPEFFLVKDIDAVESWAMWDGTREPYNKLSKKLSPNSPVAEYTANTTTYAIDFLSNGVKLRSSYSVLNASQTYIYYAIAKSPFKTSNAR